MKEIEEENQKIKEKDNKKKKPQMNKKINEVKKESNKQSPQKIINEKNLENYPHIEIRIGYEDEKYFENKKEEKEKIDDKNRKIIQPLIPTLDPKQIKYIK